MRYYLELVQYLLSCKDELWDYINNAWSMIPQNVIWTQCNYVFKRVLPEMRLKYLTDNLCIKLSYFCASLKNKSLVIFPVLGLCKSHGLLTNILLQSDNLYVSNVRWHNLEIFATASRGNNLESAICVYFYMS